MRPVVRAGIRWRDADSLFFMAFDGFCWKMQLTEHADHARPDRRRVCNRKSNGILPFSAGANSVKAKAGLLTRSRSGAFPARRPVAKECRNKAPRGAELTAAETVADFHGIPFSSPPVYCSENRCGAKIRFFRYVQLLRPIFSRCSPAFPPAGLTFRKSCPPFFLSPFPALLRVRRR